MIRVVPPVDGVVEVERVAGDVDEEREDEERVKRVRVLERFPATPEEPLGGGHDQRRERIRQRPTGHRFPLEALESGEDGEQEQPDQRRLDGKVQPERGSIRHPAG
jgi:hypothetical protein